MPKYVELHSLLLALYKNKEESVQVSTIRFGEVLPLGRSNSRSPQRNIPPEVIHFGVYDNLGERPDTRGQKHCLVLSSSRDVLLDDLVIALDTESELHHWREKILDEIHVSTPRPESHCTLESTWCNAHAWSLLQ